MNTLYISLTVLVIVAIIPENLAAASCSMIKAFVDGHNSRRLAVARGEIRNQPAASNMKMMVWDHELEAKAAAWARVIRTDHSPSNLIPSRRFQAGESLFWQNSYDRNFKVEPEQVLDSWFDEHVNYTFRALKNSDFDPSLRYYIAHYTQLVWADTIYIGCAITQKFEGGLNKFFAVCNYGPSGNYIGEKPYIPGRGKFDLLCGCPENDANCNCNKPYGRNC